MHTPDSSPDFDPSQPLSVDDAMALATRLHRDGQRATAFEIYRRVLAIVPKHTDALHFMGLLAHEQGAHADAIRLMAYSVELAPNHPPFRSNFGNVLLTAERFEEAEDQYRAALALEPDRPDALINYAVLCATQRRFEEGEQFLRRLVDLHPDFTAARQNLARLYLRQGRIEEATSQALEAIARDPDSTPTRELLGYAYCRLARFEEAAQVFRHWLAMEPDHPKARHLLAACSGEAVPPRASDAYVKSVFDDFADSFDGRLAKLDYRAPALTAAAIADCLGAGAGDLEVLDAGCGTGLCGPLLKPFAGRLIGVDLSSRMLDKARARGLYDDLCQAEIASYLQGQPERFDLIVSADTLVYFGLLDAVMTAGGRALRPGGLLCFTLEALDDAETGDYRLRYHGRYAHASTYVRARLEQAGLTVLRCDRETLRKEGGEPVPGWVVLARRPAMAPEALLATRS